jgi:hypothetical protein
LVLTFRLIPSWGWFLVVGLICVAALSIIADYTLPPNPCVRATWSTIQVIAGLLAFLIAGAVGATRLGAMHESLSLMDMLLPDRVWGLVIKRLPATRWYVCTGAWSAMAVLCGILCVGNLTYWLPTKKAPPKPAKVAFTIRSNDQSSEDEAPAEKPDRPKTEETEQPAGPKMTVTKCVIVGYTTKDGELDGLVLATVLDDELSYAGIVPASRDPEVRTDLLKRFGSLKVDTPVFPDLDVEGIWLKPRLICEVESAGFDDDQVLKEPKFKGLHVPERPEPARAPDGKGKDAKDAGSGKSAADGKKNADAKNAGAKDGSSPK